MTMRGAGRGGCRAEPYIGHIYIYNIYLYIYMVDIYIYIIYDIYIYISYICVRERERYMHIAQQRLDQK